jgi:hypothetical protein
MFKSVGDGRLWGAGLLWLSCDTVIELGLRAFVWVYSLMCLATVHWVFGAGRETKNSS